MASFILPLFSKLRIKFEVFIIKRLFKHLFRLHKPSINKSQTFKCQFNFKDFELYLLISFLSYLLKFLDCFRTIHSLSSHLLSPLGCLKLIQKFLKLLATFLTSKFILFFVFSDVLLSLDGDFLLQYYKFTNLVSLSSIFLSEFQFHLFHLIYPRLGTFRFLLVVWKVKRNF